jgi:hypothetical protein
MLYPLIVIFIHSFKVSAIIFNGSIKPLCGLNSNHFSIRPTESCEMNGKNNYMLNGDLYLLFQALM